MKARFLGKITSGTLLLLLPLLGACTPQSSSPPSPTNTVPTVTNTVSATATDAAPAMETVSTPDLAPPGPASPMPPDSGVASLAPPDAGTLSIAPDSDAAAGGLPPNIYPASPLAQVVRMSQAGVDESVILTFIANAGSTFNLDSDKIIYLKDIGLPNEVVTAMMQHDQQLRQQMAAAQPETQPAPAETTAETETAAPPAEQPAAPPTEVTINNFYDTLAPYGSWITVDGYGRCWRPSVVVYNPAWQPYCDHGRWIYTDCGWYWSSDYTWGWAAFHYGRWFRHSHWGWCWAPDTIWGPSWVTWRYSNGYCGWAPLPPYATYRAGIGFFYRGGAVSFGFNWGLGENCYTFVPTQYFCDPHPRRRCLAPGQVTQIFNQTTVINNFQHRDHNRGFVNRGIEPEHITAVTHAPIRPVTIRNITVPPGEGPRADRLSRDGSTLTVSHPPRNGFPTELRRQPQVPTVTTRSPQDRGIRVPPARDDNRPAAPTGPVRQPQVPVVTTRSPQDGGVIRVPPAQNDNRPVAPTRPVRQPQAPVVTPPNPQPGGAVRIPAQRPTQPASPPANYRPASTPNSGNRYYPPRLQEQNQSSGAPRGGSYNSGAPAFNPPVRSGPSGASEAGRRSPTAVTPIQPQPRQPASPPPAVSSPGSSGYNQNQSVIGNNFGGRAGNGPVFGPRR